jgi:hypothetical protein
VQVKSVRLVMDTVACDQTPLMGRHSIPEVY